MQLPGTKTKQHTASSFRDTRCHEKHHAALFLHPLSWASAMTSAKGVLLHPYRGVRNTPFVAKHVLSLATIDCQFHKF